MEVLTSESLFRSNYAQIPIIRIYQCHKYWKIATFLWNEVEYSFKRNVKGGKPEYLVKHKTDWIKVMSIMQTEDETLDNQTNFPLTGAAADHVSSLNYFIIHCFSQRSAW